MWTRLLVVLVVLLNRSGADVTPWPLLPPGTPCGPCVCFHPGPAVDCSSRSLTSVPHSGLPTTATSLTLHNNSISFLEDLAFQHFHSLRHLDLSRNLISNISSSAFNQLFRLTRLNLEHNSLGTFQDLLPFAFLPALTHLNLSHNLLTSLSEDVGLASCLRWLDLSHNHLTTVQVSGAVSVLSNLTFLDLSHNQLDGIHQLLEATHSLQTLNLSHNQIALNDVSYPQDVFTACRSSLLTLRLEGNCEAGVLSENLSYPDQALSQLSRLVYLHMDGLPNAVFGSGFRNMTSLTNLSLSGQDGSCSMIALRNDTFLHIPHSLLLLNLSYCHISQIEGDAFKPLQQLRSLELSGNIDLGFETVGNAFYSLQGSALRALHINSIIRPYSLCVMVTPWHTRYFRNTSLRTIHAKNNRLEAFCRGTLLNMPESLEVVNVNENELGFGSYFKDLQSLTNLKEIYNDGHGLASKPPTEYPDDETQYCAVISHGSSGSGQHCPRLLRPEDSMEMMWTPEPTDAELHASPNQPSMKLVYTLPPNLETYVSRWDKLYYTILEVEFHPNNSLTTLILKDNLITTWIGPVNGLNKLVTLNIANNLIKYISDPFFDTLTSLKELNASWNVLRGVIARDTSGRLFKPLTKLEGLYLSKNYLHSLPVAIFSGLVSLQRLDLAHNSMYEFHVNITHMKNLTFLDLSYNNIHYLPKAVMDHLDSVAEHVDVTVDITFNPIACTCKHIDFLIWIHESRVHFPQTDSYTCLMSDGNYKKMENIFDVIENLRTSCADRSGILMGTITCFFCLTLVLVSALVYRYRWKLRYLYYASRLAYRRLDTDEHDEFQYDAFVSYSSEDTDFVHGELLEELETRAGLRLNVHDRDFTPGRLIPCNIVDAVQNSRRTLVVLTQALVQSDWCHYEMQMATMEAAHSGRDVLLFLVYEDMPSQDLPRDVLYNLQASTYITFPAQAPPPLVQDFWARLVQAITQ